jgi:hypothetical protein
MVRVHMRALLVAVVGVILSSASLPWAQDVRVNIGLGLPLALSSPPPLVVVPGTSVYYAPDVAANFFFYKGHYYTAVNGAWSMAPSYNGPWAVIQIGQVPSAVLGVPVEYYKIPPGQLKRHGPPPWAGHGHGPHPKKSKGR